MLLQAMLAAAPSATALCDEQRAVDYATLPALLAQETAWLHAGDDERFALLADNGVPWALADLALHLGASLCVPVPASFSDALKRHALEDAGVDTLLTDDLAAAHRLLPDWRADGVGPASGLFRLRRGGNRGVRPAVPPGTRKVTYTSGSTAQPRGVCLSGASLEAIAHAVAEATAELVIERHLCLLPLATLLENVAGLYAPLLRSATCVLPSSQVTGMSYAALDPQRLLGTVARQRPQSLILVPELLQVLVRAAEQGWPVPSSLRFVAVGGARVSPALLARAEAVGVPAYEGYGLSECASVVCLNTPRAKRSGTVGRPLPHVRVRVDAAGQVHVAGNAMLGYLGDPPRPADAEVATGDLGAFDADGYLRLEGRAGNRFITSFGRNVSPEWLEAEISQRLGAAPVLACGEAQPFVVALVGASPAQADDPTVERALAGLNAELPEYARVRRWARTERPFSHADGTLTANGRLRRAEIQHRHADLIASLYAATPAS